MYNKEKAIKVIDPENNLSKRSQNNQDINNP
jgi:hypothetical protein